MQACRAPTLGGGRGWNKVVPPAGGPRGGHEAALEWFPVRAGGARMLGRLGTCSFPSKLRPQTVCES